MPPVIRSTFVFARSEHATRRMLRLYVVKPGHFIVDTINAEGVSEVVEMDFSTWEVKTNWVRGAEWARNAPADLIVADFVTKMDYDNLYRLDQYWDHDDWYTYLDWYHASDTPPPDSRIYTETYPSYLIWDDTPQTPPTPTVSYSELTMTYPQKQDTALRTLESWRTQKRAWLLEVEQRSDLHPELVKHAGYWLRAADRALQIEFQDPDVDPIIVAQMAREAIKGAADIDSVDKFAMYLNGFITQFPNGPDRPTLWVTKGEGSGSLADVQRVNLADSHQYPAGTLAVDYNPIDSEWQVPNQPGVVSVNTVTPDANFTVTAEVLDPDGVVGTPTYQWQKLVSGVWADEIGETGSSYLIVDGTAAGTQFRCLAAYTDNYGPNQSAISQVITVQ